MVSRGENTPSLGVGGTSTNCIPGTSENDWWIGLFVIVSARGDSRAASSGKLRITATCRSGGVSFLSTGFGGGPKFKDPNPNPAAVPNRCAPKPGDGGGFGNEFGGGKPGDIGGLDMSSGTSPGDGGGFDIEGGHSLGERGGFDKMSGANPGDGGGREKLIDGADPDLGWVGAIRESRLKRPNLPGSDSSSFSDHEKLEGAEDGPGEIGSPLLGVEFPRALFGLLWGVGCLGTGSSAGRGALRGPFGDTSIWSADKVALCLVGLLPARGLNTPPGESFFLETSF